MTEKEIKHLEEIDLGAEQPLGVRFNYQYLRPSYVMAFVYAPNGNFLIKGSHRRVENYLSEKFPICFYRQVFYSKYISRNKRGVWGANGYMLRQKYVGKRLYWCFIDRRGLTVAKFRRLPNKWPSQLNYDSDTNLLVAADFMEEQNWLQAAAFIRTKIKEEFVRRGF